MLKPIDLRSVHLGTSLIFRAEKRSAAEAFARSCGWRASDVKEAANRFWKFWIVGQQLGASAETFRVLLKDKSWVDVPWPGRWE
jgi:hypothetical protein